MHTRPGRAAVANHRSTPVPADLWRRPLQTIRPQDVTGTYAHPRPEIARLSHMGLLHRVARGYYVVVPPEHVGRAWLPSLEAAAAGIASSIYGADNAILMGVSAARVWGAVPRALATAVVAVPQQHRPITLSDRPAVIRFVRRDTDALDAERVETPLGPALATSVEQTVLDLAKRPKLGNAEADVSAAVATLYARSDHDRLAQLAATQRLDAALRRAETWGDTGTSDRWPTQRGHRSGGSRQPARARSSTRRGSSSRRGTQSRQIGVGTGSERYREYLCRQTRLGTRLVGEDPTALIARPGSLADRAPCCRTALSGRATG